MKRTMRNRHNCRRDKFRRVGGHSVYCLGEYRFE